MTKANEGFTSQVMLCWPSDRAAIAKLNADLPAGQRFTPSVEHTLSDCDGCHRSVWIGPQQLQLVNSAFVRTRKLCPYCTGYAQSALNLRARQVDINPELINARRRTA